MFCCLVSALNSLSQCTESTVRVSHSMGHVDVKPLVMENATSIQGEVKMDVGLQAGRLILGNNVRPRNISFAYLDMDLKPQDGTREADYQADMGRLLCVTLSAVALVFLIQSLFVNLKMLVS